MSTESISAGSGIDDGPVVTVVLPTRNGAGTLGEALESVLGQTYSRFECIVIDDGSTDSTPERLAGVMAADPRVRVIRHDRPLGLQRALNRGLQEARGPLVARIDDDDVWTRREKLSDQVRAFGADPALQLVGTGAWMIRSRSAWRLRAAVAVRGCGDPAGGARLESLRALERHVPARGRAGRGRLRRTPASQRGSRPVVEARADGDARQSGGRVGSLSPVCERLDSRPPLPGLARGTPARPAARSVLPWHGTGAPDRHRPVLSARASGVPFATERLAARSWAVSDSR